MDESNFLNAISRIDLKVSVKSDEMKNEQTASLATVVCATAELSLSFNSGHSGSFFFLHTGVL
jgi:hypothetical protein